MRTGFIRQATPVGFWNGPRQIRATLQLFIAFAALSCPFIAATQVVDPAPGRPAFVAPGSTLRVIVAEELPAPVRCALVADSLPRATIPLTAEAADSTGPEFRLHLPPHVPTGVYGLRIESGTTRYESTSCVSVCRITDKLRVLQIPGPMIGDLLQPTLDWKLNDEINLLAPDVVVICGNYVDPLHEDADAAWQEFTEWLRRLDVPVIAAFGPRDDITAYSRYLAPGSLGCIAVGPFSFMTINDSTAAPLQGDENQMNWLRTVLHTRSAANNFLISDSIHPTTSKTIEKILDSKEGAAVPLVWIANREIAEADGMGAVARDRLQRQKSQRNSIQTVVLPDSRDRFQQSFNILECAHNDGETTNRPLIRQTEYHPGSLVLRRDATADAPQASAAATIWNRSHTARSDLRLHLQVQKTTAEHPWVIGGRLVQLADHGSFWNCTIRFDVAPDSRTRVVAGVGSQPAHAALRVEIHESKQADATSNNPDPSRRFATVRVTNGAREAITIRPEARIDQEPARYGVATIATAPAWGYEISLDTNESTDLIIDPSHLSCPRESHTHRLQVFASGQRTALPAIAEIPCGLSQPSRANSATFDALRSLYEQEALVPPHPNDAPIPFRVRVANP
ncbi:MAG: metallophosphoesterase [Phycisphaerae bacterium]